MPTVQGGLPGWFPWQRQHGESRTGRCGGSVYSLRCRSLGLFIASQLHSLGGGGEGGHSARGKPPPGTHHCVCTHKSLPSPPSPPRPVFCIPVSRRRLKCSASADIWLFIRLPRDAGDTHPEWGRREAVTTWGLSRAFPSPEPTVRQASDQIHLLCALRGPLSK